LQLASERLGEVTVSREDMVDLPEGLPGLPDMRQCYLVRREADAPVVWLQDAADESLTVPLLPPEAFIEDYCPALSPSDWDFLGLSEATGAEYYLVLVIPADPAGITVNLRAPIVRNPETGVARQVILSSEAYPIRYPLFDGGAGTEDPHADPK